MQYVYLLLKLIILRELINGRSWHQRCKNDTKLKVFRKKWENDFIFVHWINPTKWRKQYNKTRALNLTIANIHHTPIKSLFYRNSGTFEDCVNTLFKSTHNNISMNITFAILKQLCIFENNTYPCCLRNTPVEHKMQFKQSLGLLGQ